MGECKPLAAWSRRRVAVGAPRVSCAAQEAASSATHKTAASAAAGAGGRAVAVIWDDEGRRWRRDRGGGRAAGDGAGGRGRDWSGSTRRARVSGVGGEAGVRHLMSDWFVR